MDKLRYFIRKILNALLTIILVACFNFMLFRILPGNPARLLLPKGHYSAQAIAKQIRYGNSTSTCVSGAKTLIAVLRMSLR